jgi:hypothetical protein
MRLCHLLVAGALHQHQQGLVWAFLGGRAALRGSLISTWALSAEGGGGPVQVVGRGARYASAAASVAGTAGGTTLSKSSASELADAAAPAFTHEDLPDETLYVLDGTAMLFKAHYGRGATR